MLQLRVQHMKLFRMLFRPHFFHLLNRSVEMGIFFIEFAPFLILPKKLIAFFTKQLFSKQGLTKVDIY